MSSNKKDKNNQDKERADHQLSKIKDSEKGKGWRLFEDRRDVIVRQEEELTESEEQNPQIADIVSSLFI